MSCFLFTFFTNCRLQHVDFYVMLATSFWWCWRFCLSCAQYVNIYRTHTWCCKSYHVCVVTVIRMSISSVALVSHTHRSVTLSVCCLDGSRCLVVESCWVCVRKVMHAHVHSLTHLVILLKLCQPDHPPTARPPLSRTTQSQPSLTMYYCPKLHRAWHCLLCSLHCTMLESTQLTIT